MLTAEAEKVTFGPGLRQWQRECSRIDARFLVLALHRRAGKTELALRRLIAGSIRNRRELPQYAYVAPMLKQAKIIAWARLKQLLSGMYSYGGCEFNESELVAKIAMTGALIRIVGADNPDALRGWGLDGVVLDEVAQMKTEVWDDIIRPALADRGGWAWFLGTPKGINLFSELFYKARDLPRWESRLYTCYDTDALPAEEIELMRMGMSETAFAREMLCDFSASGDDQLLSLADIEASARRILKSDDYQHAGLVLGVDPARFGNDRSVIVRRQGLMMWEPIIIRQADNMELASRVAGQIDQHQPDAVFIDAGAGSGVIDRLRQLGYGPVEVNFGGRPNDARYFNKRSEMWHEMAEWVRSGGRVHNFTDLKLELATPTYKFDQQNKIQLESKDDIKKRMPGNASPDCADALALTFAHSVQRRSAHELLMQKNHRNQRLNYDPLANLS